jgi:rfaE bifunctional protein nucleotidyltransferase chain/domain
MNVALVSICDALSGAVVDLIALAPQLEQQRRQRKRIVLTNGVFDVLHVGHLRYLREARRRGDVLVVGINADSSVHKPGRPLVPDLERAELVAALEPVDYAVIFSELTADLLLRHVRPDVYVKGGDYSEATLPEAATAREIGAEMVFVPLIQHRSTSALIQRLSE